MKWFHGTRAGFDAFDDRFIGVGNDERGPGLYFTSEEDTARHYAGPEGVVIEADPGIACPMPRDAILDRRQIAAIIRQAPDHIDTLQNFGEIDLEGYEVVLARAVATYLPTADGHEDPIGCISLMANDFWRGEEAAMLAVVCRETGYDGIVRQVGGETHAVAWSASQVRIIAMHLVAASNAPTR